MIYDICYFGDIRKQAFQLWVQGTKRDCRWDNDDIVDSFECKWQDRASDLGYDHISIFCSLGEWANNLSDFLKDETYDFYDFLDKDHSQVLFRYYTRLLLVISEILGDFEEIVQKVESPKNKNARDSLSSTKGEVDSLINFINRVCKHKVNYPQKRGFHHCNHHLPIWYKDCKQNSTFTRPISIENLDFKQPDSVLIPELDYLVRVILNCYTNLDNLFEKKPDKFKMICDEYNGISCEI